jgi:glutathione S-transferase
LAWLSSLTNDSDESKMKTHGESMYKLYYYPSNANLAPHMLLEELGVPFELVLIDRVNSAHKSPEYLKLNPTGRIPTLIDGDLVLHETAAICLHLVDMHPEAGFAPAPGTVERAEFYKWLAYLSNTVQPEIITYYYSHRLADDEACAAQVKKHAEARLAEMFDLIEDALADNHAKQRGPFLLGAHYTAVDPYLAMLSRWTRVMDKPARNRQHLGKYLATIFERPAVQRTFAAEGLLAPLY